MNDICGRIGMTKLPTLQIAVYDLEITFAATSQQFAKYMRDVDKYHNSLETVAHDKMAVIVRRKQDYDKLRLCFYAGLDILVDKVSFSEILGLLAHEVSHCLDMIWEDMSESEAGEEVRATHHEHIMTFAARETLKYLKSIKRLNLTNLNL
jgi:hypothetical protein